jgi:hypothetical protein
VEIDGFFGVFFNNRIVRYEQYGNRYTDRYNSSAEKNGSMRQGG